MFKMLSAFLILVSSIPAFATHYSGTRTFFVQYHFSDMAFGKKVSSVMIHSGALVSWCGRPDGWKDEKSIIMTKKGDHFNARTVIAGPVDSGCAGTLGVIVEYWVTFEDGTSMITTPTMVPTKAEGSVQSGDKASELLKKAQENLKSAPDSDKTESTYIEYGHVS